MRRNGWVIFFAFLGGIVLANLAGKDVLSGYGILNEYYLNQYSWHTLDCDRLFCSIFLERIKDVIILVVLGHLIRGKLYLQLVWGAFAMGIGFLMTVSIVNFGMKGIAVILGGMFPQWLFYLTAFLVYGRMRSRPEYVTYRFNRVKEWSAQAVVCVLSIILILLGVLTESYLNPILFDKIVKIM